MSAINEPTPLVNDVNFFSYFSPFSSYNFDSYNKFEKLKTTDKIVTIALTFFATLISLPILGLGGLAMFRLIVEKYTICKIDPTEQGILLKGKSLTDSAKAAAEKTWQFATDDMCLGFNTEHFQNKSLLENLGLRLGIRNPLEKASKLEPQTNLNIGQAPPPPSPQKERGRSNSLVQEMHSSLVDSNTVENEEKKETFESQYPRERLAEACKTLNKLASFENAVLLEKKEELTRVANYLHQYLSNVASEKNKEESESVVKFLTPLRDSLVNLTLILNSFKKECENQEAYEEVTFIEALLEQIDHMMSHLPIEQVLQEGFLARLRGALNQSEGKEISWKVQKYESIIIELRGKFKENFGKELDSLDLSSSWANASDPLDQVRELYHILLSVPLKNTSDRYNQEYLKQIRNSYNKDFLPKLRCVVEALLRTPGGDGDEKIVKEKEHLYKVCEILFTQINLEQECFETLELFALMGAQMLGQEFKQEEEPLIDQLHTLYSRIHAVPYSAKVPIMESLGNSARGQWNRDFDPYLQGNPVHILYQLKIGEKDVKALGMGTPTNEDKNSKACVNPEFLGFLQSYKIAGKKHLYVSNQDTIPKTGLLAMFLNGDETNRSNILLNLQHDDNYKGTYYAIALSKNSSFYFQKEKYKDLTNSNSFKDELYNQVFELDKDVSGCYIPKEIKEIFIEKGNKNKAKEIINFIHMNVFDNKNDLSEEERKEFIELFYDQLIKLILAEKKIDSFNISCKDAIDRGAGSNAQLYSNSLLIESMVDNPSHVQRIKSLMLARALYVRKRVPINERFLRFVEGLEFGLKHQEKIKALHKSIFGDLKFIPLGPDKKASHPSVNDQYLQNPYIPGSVVDQNPFVEQSLTSRVVNFISNFF
jgi:hypothetical protein